MKLLVVAGAVVALAGTAQAQAPAEAPGSAAANAASNGMQAAMQATMKGSEAAALRAKVPPGYLAGKPPVDILKLLPPPPAAGSAQEIADRTIYATSAQGVGGVAWKSAIEQLNPTGPAFMGLLSCAVGVKISPATTPVTMAMIARSGVDFITPMAAAKEYYKRPRPFTTDKGAACDPVSSDGVGARLGFSYPSGHAGVGWMWALMLADAVPAKASQIRQFGMETGDLRVACRVHWLSDVASGRMLGTAVYQRTAAEPAYQADLAKAKAELAAAPPLVCEAAKQPE